MDERIDPATAAAIVERLSRMRALTDAHLGRLLLDHLVDKGILDVGDRRVLIEKAIRAAEGLDPDAFDDYDAVAAGEE